jgi:hypothetical protein
VEIEMVEFSPIELMATMMLVVGDILVLLCAGSASLAFRILS